MSAGVWRDQERALDPLTLKLQVSYVPPDMDCWEMDSGPMKEQYTGSLILSHISSPVLNFDNLNHVYYSVKPKHSKELNLQRTRVMLNDLKEGL